MERKLTKKIIQEPKEIEIEVFVTKDGREFENEQEAIEHEKVDIIKQKSIKSKIINNSLITQYISPFKFVRFENEQQIEAFEQKMCGNKNDNTWGSWVSCKEKFNQLPCWIMYKYVQHSWDNDYTAIYLTLDEVKEDLLGVIGQMEKLQ